MGEKTNTKYIIHIVLRTLIIGVLLAFIVFGCIYKFSIKYYPECFGYRYLGVTTSTSKPLNANTCDLILLDKLDSIYSLKQGDMLYARVNDEIYYVSVEKNVMLTDKKVRVSIVESGVDVELSADNIVGTMHSKIPVIGLLPAVIHSYSGIICFSVLLLLYIIFIVLSNASQENDAEDKLLLDKIRHDRRIKNETIRLARKYKDVYPSEIDIDKMLSGTASENIENINKYLIDSKNILSFSFKYKKVLYEMHRKLLSKEVLIGTDKEKISNLVEIVGEVDEIDEDIEFRLVDLILKSDVVQFDDRAFTEYSIKYLNKEISKASLYNYILVFYSILTRNKKIKGTNLEKIKQHYNKKALELDVLEDDTFLAVSKSINEALCYIK
ncbi:MAG: hypothetical protein RR334_00095 [Clostridia bacterium]